jgi:hypothetical protein
MPASVASFVRGLPLFFASVPRTPLRVLCVIALDTIHLRRHAQALPRQRRQDLAAFLDFQACTNAAWDGKDRSDGEHQALRRRLEQAGLGSWIDEYLGHLRVLESQRPVIGGDRRRFDDVRAYREAVVRLSLATIAAIALDAECVDAGIAATHGDRDVSTLFRLAMQCQVIDDVLDYREDLSLGLPSFLTASQSLPEAMALTPGAVRSYGASPPQGASALFSLRLALRVVTAAAALAVRAARWRCAGVGNGP